MYIGSVVGCYRNCLIVCLSKPRFLKTCIFIWGFTSINFIYLTSGTLVYYDVFAQGTVNMLSCNKTEKTLFELDFSNLAVS